MYFNTDDKIQIIDYHGINEEDGDNPAKRNRKLIIAIAERDREKVDFLLAQGVDLNAGLSCPNRGTYNGIKLRVPSAWSKRSPSPCFPGRTPVMHACIKHRPEILNLFLEYDEVDINVQDKLGSTALMFAVDSENLQAVDALLNFPGGLEINLQNSKKQTALLMAAGTSTFDMVEMLLNGGAHVNLPDEKGLSPLMMAADWHICDLLIQAEANVNQEDELGRTALIHAAKKGFHNHVRILLQQEDIDVDHRDSQTALTAFELAVWKNQTKVVEEFINSPRCPSLLRPMEQDRMGRVRSFFETAKKRGNKKMANKLYEAMQHEFSTLIASLFVAPRLNIDIIQVIASYSV